MPNRKIIYSPQNTIAPTIEGKKLAFFDLEFTGLNFDHEILEIGLALVNPKTFKIEKEWSKKTKPKNIEIADPIALKVNEYSEEKWKDAVSLKEGLEEFNSLVKGAILVGWNVSWDLYFLFKSCGEENVKFTAHWQVFDVVSMAYGKLHQKVDNFRMHKIIEFLNIDTSGKELHNALDDAKLTYEIFMKLKDL